MSDPMDECMCGHPRSDHGPDCVWCYCPSFVPARRPTVSDDLRNAISDAVNAEIVKLEGEVERLRARIAQLESRKREAAWPTTTGLTPPV